MSTTADHRNAIEARYRNRSTSTPGSGLDSNYDAIERAAKQQAGMLGTTVAPLYVPGGDTKVTAEKIIAAQLESEPEIYRSYKAKHDAAGTVRTLQAAGIRIG